MLNIFVVNGYPQSGKTFFGELVGEIIHQRGGHFLHLSSITPIKILLRPQELWDPDEIDPSMWEELEGMKRSITNLDWDGETKDEYWRRTMFEFKALITERMPDFIHQWVFGRAEHLGDNSTVFVDIRERDNILAFEKFCNIQQKDCNVRKIFVESDRAIHADNFADRELDPTLYDFKVSNYRAGVAPSESIELLRGEAVRFINAELPFLANGPESR